MGKFSNLGSKAIRYSAQPTASKEDCEKLGVEARFHTLSLLRRDDSCISYSNISIRFFKGKEKVIQLINTMCPKIRNLVI
jgi:hypothetical protein